jgi:hypothetical protein
MFFPGSRYENAATIPVTRTDGTIVLAVKPPRRDAPEAERIHRRIEGQRLDHIAWHYLGDPTTFWRLCDTAGALSADALDTADRVPVPPRSE